MTLTERLMSEMTNAMRQRDAPRRETLRLAVSAVRNAEKAARRPLSDEEVVGILAREVKTRRESVEAYTRAGRPELAEKEETEIAVLGEFLPRALDEDELRSLVSEAVDEVGASSARDLGRVMAVLSPRIRGRADGRLASGFVAQELARRDVAAHRH